MKNRFLLTCIACLLTLGAFAQKNKIDDYFKSMAGQQNGNILLKQNGKIIASVAAGYADFETKKINTTDARFNLASISKVFTATAILQLRDNGKLSLDDQLTKFFPGLPFQGVTLRHLLTHTSGLPDFELYDMISKNNPGKVITNAAILPALMDWKNGSSFAPGEHYRYCNVGYIVLALVIEKVSGMPYSAFLKKNIFNATGMKDTYVSVYPGHFFFNDDRCVKMHYQPHPYYDTTYVHADSTARDYIRFANFIANGTYGEGNIITTTGDLAQFDRAYFDGRLLKAATMQEAFTPMKLNNGEVFYERNMDTMEGEGKESVGLGWEIFDQPVFGKSVGHGGYLYGNATFYFHNLDKNQTIIGFTNTGGSEFGRIVTSCLSLLNDKAPLEIRTHHSMAFVYGSTLVKDGPDAAASALNAVKSDTAHYYLSEWEFNQLGGNLLYRSSFGGHKLLALEVFKINTLLFPDSFNTYDSYAAGLREVGMKQQAIKMYQKSIALNPNNEDGKHALRELLDGK
jgi:CubicO group peptidase (beta-lactamase class C family)